MVLQYIYSSAPVGIQCNGQFCSSSSFPKHVIHMRCGNSWSCSSTVSWNSSLTQWKLKLSSCLNFVLWQWLCKECANKHRDTWNRRNHLFWLSPSARLDLSIFENCSSRQDPFYNLVGWLCLVSNQIACMLMHLFSNLCHKFWVWNRYTGVVGRGIKKGWNKVFERYALLD